MTEYKCPDCEVLMEQGFIPDRVNTGYDMTYWMNGQFTSMTAMGFARGTGGVSDCQMECRPLGFTVTSPWMSWVPEVNGSMVMGSVG